MNSLDVRNINCFYGSTQVLWDVSLVVKSNEIVAVVGSNGAGKTTLLRAISGLHKISRGSILWGDKEIANIPPDLIVGRGISQISEGGGIFPYMTVVENLRVGAYLKRSWKKQREGLEKIFVLFPELESRKNQLAGTLSGGERQMLGIGKGLMSSPQLLLLDEPSLGLSPKLVLKLFDGIKAIHQQGITILLIEQNVYHAMRLSHTAYLLENGRTLRGGSSKELMEDHHVKKAYLGL
jgi:branched-chain amino acid transport system ATP-binding protein